MPDKIDYKSVLNPQQLKAVMTVNGPLLVIAGAGSGKTRTLIYRVARLVETGVPPESILLLTFTRKAAGEMLERAAGLSDERCRNVSGGTFHSLAYRVLRSHAGVLGFENAFTILDRSDMEEIIQSLVRELNIDRGAIRFPKRATLANIISKAANLQQSVEALIQEDFSQFIEHAPVINNLKEAYGKYKRDRQLMDYDDLILNFRDILSSNEEIRSQLSEQYPYIMVDEYQDTNEIQSDIVKWLGISHQNVMVVGDDSQSIYSFRGANYKNMFEFPTIFPEAKMIKLEENYRSTQPILTMTNSLMEQAYEKYTKCLFTKRADGEKPKVVDTRTAPEQAMFICRSITEQLNQGRSLKDFAVLFRAAYQSFDLEMELARQGIPFVKYGGFKFMESAHIKDLLAHIRVVVNNDDSISWGRVLKLVRNIGQNKSQAIINWMKKNQFPPSKINEWPRARKGESGLENLSKLLGRLSEGSVRPRNAVELVLEYYDPILMDKYDDFPKRRRDLEQLITMADRYRKLRSFIDELALDPPTSSADIRNEYSDDYLTLSTVHSAKGLEWPFVFIIWVMDGYFPSARAGLREEELEEERRLMYVGATRAKDHLIMCYPGRESAPVWSNQGGYNRGLSTFIQTLPEGVVQYESSGSSFRTTGFRRSAPSKPFTKKKGKPHSSGLKSGDRVSHPAFGDGVVSRLIDKEKIEVLFRNVGRKRLHLGYTTLEKR